MVVLSQKICECCLAWR